MKCPVCNSPTHQVGCPFEGNGPVLAIEPGFADEEADDECFALPLLSDDY